MAKDKEFDSGTLRVGTLRVRGMNRILFAICMMSFLLIVSPIQAESFDCARAAIDVEKLICADAELSKLDEELSMAYKTALQDENEEQAEIIRQSQKNWVKYRDNCKDTLCVKAAYEIRLSTLTVTHVYEFTWAETEEEQRAAGFTSSSIDMRRPGYPFKINNGEGIEVCEIYKKNLEALGNTNLACERRVSPEYADVITLPEWFKLDLWENRNLWARLEKMALGGINMPGRMESKNISSDDQYQIDQSAKFYQENTERYHREVYKLNVANIDVDNDGKRESVLRYGSGQCGEPVHYTSIALFIINEKDNIVDVQKSRPLFQDSWYNPWDKKLEQSGTFSNGSMYDIFVYKDKTYFDRWTWTGVWVYQISNGKAEAICHLK